MTKTTMTKAAMTALLTTLLAGGAVTLAQARHAPQATQAQQPTQAPPTPAKAPEKPLVPLRVQVTLSRFNGETKTSSLPFTLWVNANDQQKTTLNVGIQVSVGNQYRSVGTNLACLATNTDDGRFRIDLSVDDSSVAPSKESGGLASFQSLNAHNFLLLRDGQNAQFVAATDKVTGEVTKVDVTVTVLK